MESMHYPCSIHSTTTTESRLLELSKAFPLINQPSPTTRSLITAATESQVKLRKFLIFLEALGIQPASTIAQKRSQLQGDLPAQPMSFELAQTLRHVDQVNKSFDQKRNPTQWTTKLVDVR